MYVYIVFTQAYNMIDVLKVLHYVSEQKTDVLQTAIIEALKEPAHIADPLDGFLARLGEGMRRLSYRDRSRLEIQFLTLLAEEEEKLHHKQLTT